MLDEGSGIVGTKREIAAEANVGSDDCAERESNELVFRLCMRVEVIIPVHQISVVGIFYNSGGNIAKRSGKRGELLIGRMQNFFFVRR